MSERERMIAATLEIIRHLEGQIAAQREALSRLTRTHQQPDGRTG